MRRRALLAAAVGAAAATAGCADIVDDDGDGTAEEDPETEAENGEERNGSAGGEQAGAEDGAQDGTGGPPQATWAIREVTDGSGAVAAVEFRHDGGEVLDVMELSVRVDLSATGAGAGATDVGAGDTLTVGLGATERDAFPAGETVEVLWTGGIGTTTLASHELSAGTVGGLDIGFEVSD